MRPLVPLLLLCACQPAPDPAHPCGATAAHGHEIVVGVIPPRQEDGEFTEVLEGDAVPLQFGSQAAWMMVLAIRLPPDVSEGGSIVAAAEVVLTDGTLLSEVQRRRLTTVEHEDGFRYAQNLFLPLGADDPVLRRFGWDGREADLRVTITDRCGHDVTVEHRVVLVKP